jgi:oxygen-independent coproporphyrinogen-3 oxidase
LCLGFSDFGKRRYTHQRPVKAIYFGGGTPTVFAVTQLERILCSLKKHIRLDTDYEITFETTLHNLNPEKLELFGSLGVNRLSLGVQTFCDKGRKLLTRTCSRKEALKRVYNARDKFEGTLSIDLIYAYPEQSEQDLQYDIQESIKLKPDSISFYSLRLHPSSKLAQAIECGRLGFNPDINRERKYHNSVLDGLRSHGYHVLDLLKVTRDDRDAHRYYQLKYGMAEVFPIGAGAGGALGNIEYYILGPGVALYNHLSPLAKKYLKILGLMQRPCVHLNQVEKFVSSRAIQQLVKKLSEFEDARLLERKEQQEYELSQDGIFWH